jgi:predicted phosphoadenosine phosphosulfate sulfurtransferase
MKKIYNKEDVFESSQMRLEFIFDNFENVLVAFSGGKDSGILLNLAYNYAKENNKLSQLAMYYQDYEAGYPQTDEYVEKEFELKKDIRRFWLCLPHSAACSCSMYQTNWIPWNPKEKEIWCKNMLERDYIVNMDNKWFDFEVGMSGFDARILFAKEFAKKYGTTAILVGIRCDESLSRLAIITSKNRNSFFLEKRYSKIIDDKVVNFYPIYDWNIKDIWIYNCKFKCLYNEVYDLMYQSGLTLDQMRTASPFHQCGQENLKLYRAICPDMWGKMISRVNGVNFCGIYGSTNAMGHRNIKKPDNYTWKQYSEFLLNTLPEKAKNDFLARLYAYLLNWRNGGKGRNPEVIRYMRKSKLKIRVTKKIAKNCHKPKVYRKVILKGDILDDVTDYDFRHIPNYKDICISILKNDFKGIYLSFGRTKQDEERKRKVLERYKKLLIKYEDDTDQLPLASPSPIPYSSYDEGCVG